jgi:hypothetical protein
MRRVPEESSVGKLGLTFGLNELIAAFEAGLRGDVADGAMKAHFMVMSDITADQGAGFFWG